MTTFNLGDRVVLKLWPELGVGKILSLTKADTDGARVARIHWPEAQQTSGHSVVAIKPASQAAAA